MDANPQPREEVGVLQASELLHGARTALALSCAGPPRSGESRES